MDSSRDITLYIPFFQADATIQACLEGVWNQTLQPTRILVIDDGSPIPFSDSRVETLRHAQNQGLAAARNTALAACRTPWMAALDADVVPESDWLEQLAADMQLNDLAGVGGCLREHYQTAIADRWRARHMAQHWGSDRIVNPRFLYGANTLFKTEAIRAVGGYDRSLRTNNEDRTLCEALRAHGQSLAYVPGAVCRHLRQDTCQTILSGYWKWHHTRGLKEGEFDSWKGVIGRIENVNFGIFKYRFDWDQRESLKEFLALDASIPWVFGCQDLKFFTQRIGLQAGVFPPPDLGAQWPVHLLNPSDRLTAPPEAQNPEFNDYCRTFSRCLESCGWSEIRERTDIWEPLIRELGGGV